MARYKVDERGRRMLMHATRPPFLAGWPAPGTLSPPIPNQEPAAGTLPETPAEES